MNKNMDRMDWNIGGFALKMLWKCQKFSFWKNGGVFGKIFGSFWEGNSGGKNRGEREGVQLIKVI